MIKVAVAGVGGRMGSLIAKQVLQDPACALSVITSRNENIVYGTLKAQAQLTPDFAVLIDFSLPFSCLENLKFCLLHKKPMVIGGTGFTLEEMQIIQEASQIIPIFKSNNMSIGAHACSMALQQIVRFLDHTWQVNIEESHHKTKRDAPSGTALMLQESIKSSGFKNDVQITSVRDEQTIGVHKVVLKNQAEIIEINHTALSREIFAMGAVKAAKWLLRQPAGLFNMENL